MRQSRGYAAPAPGRRANAPATIWRNKPFQSIAYEGRGLTNRNDEMTSVRAPAWKWEWNLNTVVILLGFAGGLVAWGATWERLSSGQDSHAISIDRLDKRVTAAEVSLRQIENHELRIAAVEKQAAEAATSMKAVENTLNSLSVDTRVMREILQRIEASQRDGAQLRR